MIDDSDFGFDDMPCGCLVTTPTRKIAFANKYFYDEFYWDVSNLVGQNIEVMLTRASHIFCDSYVYPLLLQEGECRETQLNCLTPTGSRVPVVANMKLRSDGHVAWSLFRSESRNKLIDELAEARKISEENAREAETSNAAKTAFLATMSHEIRTPLNGVIGMASALKRTQLSEDQSMMLETISGAGNHLLNLVNDVLDVAKIESESTEIEADPFIGRDLVSEVCAMLQQSAEVKDLQLLTDLSASIDAEIYGDPKRIRQVVMNLISNAIKFTDAGMIVVGADIERDSENDRPYLIISVTDSGLGVPDSQKQKIFERYGQGNHTEGLERGGIGLGLSISKMICALHGGDLIVTDAPAGGSVFTATFAVNAVISKTAIPTETEAPTPTQSPLTLLVAEDNAMNQRVVKALFGDFSVKTVFAGNGREALELLESDDFDAALIDINMPLMTGIECIRVYRKTEANAGHRRLPMIAFSANVMPEQVESYLSEGFDRNLPKPIDDESVSECLQWIYSRKAASGA